MFINKVIQKRQYYYTLSDQSVPLVTVTSAVSLLTKQLLGGGGKEEFKALCFALFPAQIWRPPCTLGYDSPAQYLGLLTMTDPVGEKKK